MSLISINLDRVRQLGEDLKSSSFRFTNAKNGISYARSGIDSQITARRNIGNRLSRACQSLDTLEIRLKGLITFLTLSVDKYNSVEDNLARKAHSIGNASDKKSLWDEFIDEYAHFLKYSKFQLAGRGAGLDFLKTILETKKLMKYAKDLNFQMYRENGKVYIQVKGGQVLNLSDYTKYRNLLRDNLGGTARWDRNFVTQLVNSGVPLYENGNGYINSNSNRFRNTPFDNLRTYIDNLGKDKWDVFRNTLKTSIPEGFKFWEDFTGYKGTSYLTKAGKFTGVVGTVFTVFDNGVESFYDKESGWDFQNGQNVQEFIVGTTVDVSTAVAAMATGAAVGSLIVPPLGTVVGAGIGLVVNGAINIKVFPGDPPKSLVDFTKDGINGAIDGIEKGVNTTIDYLEENSLSDIADDVSDKAKDIANKVEDKAGEIIDDVGKQISKLFW